MKTYGILIIILGLLFIIFSSIVVKKNSFYEYTVIEPCVDGLEGKIVSHEILCEHTYNSCTGNPRCLSNYAMISFMFGSSTIILGIIFLIFKE